jgi:hypothetical protein
MGCSLPLCKIVSNGTYSRDDRPVQKPHNPTLALTCSQHSESLLTSGMHFVSCTSRPIGHLDRTHVDRHTTHKQRLGALLSKTEDDPVKRTAASDEHTCMQVLTSGHCGQSPR